MGKRNNKFYENTSYVMTANSKFQHCGYEGLLNSSEKTSSLEDFSIALISYLAGDGEHVILSNYRHVTNLIFNHDLEMHHYSMHFLDEIFTKSKNVRVSHDTYENKNYFITVKGKEYEIEVAFTKTTFIITFNTDVNIKTVAEHFTI